MSSQWIVCAGCGKEAYGDGESGQCDSCASVPACGPGFAVPVDVDTVIRGVLERLLRKYSVDLNTDDLDIGWEALGCTCHVAYKENKPVYVCQIHGNAGGKNSPTDARGLWV